MTKINLKFSNYYLKNDFLNKYRLNNIFEKPEVVKITISFSLNQLTNSLSTNEKLTPLDALYLFYSNFSIFPLITLNLISGKKEKVEQFDSNIKIILTKKSDIDFFLYHCINTKKFKHQFNFTKKITLSSKVSINFKLPIGFVFNSNILEFDTDNFFRVNLVFKNVFCSKNSKLIIQNSL
jgi:hypothetical protein